MKILVTGVAGFIGMHVARRLLQEGHTVIGLDNLNDYYEVALKQARLAQLTGQPGFCFHPLDVSDARAMAMMFSEGAFSHVVHLAAQAGVRYSLMNPLAYVNANLTGFAHVLEGCRQHQISHLVYASSSSVYGTNAQLPF
ncbi:MAG: SDR family NAD(P)-dependent oxidoreductase, partial [Burkholderiales bacterium]